MADDGTKDGKASARAEHEPPTGAETTGTWTAGGASIDYAVNAKWIVLRKKEKPAAEIFSVSYIAESDVARAFSLFVLTLEGERISAITWFADSSAFARFGLPRMLP